MKMKKWNKVIFEFIITGIGCGREKQVSDFILGSYKFWMPVGQTLGMSAM